MITRTIDIYDWKEIEEKLQLKIGLPFREFTGTEWKYDFWDMWVDATSQHIRNGYVSSHQLPDVYINLIFVKGTDEHKHMMRDAVKSLADELGDEIFVKYYW